MIKMRTYSRGTPTAPTHEIYDYPMLNVGKLYRNLKLDEVPQIINVIRGDMSLVGPRPCLLMQSELIRLREEAGEFDLRPGITGVAQIEGIDMRNPVALVRSDKVMVNLRLVAYFLVLLYTIMPRKIMRKG